jgi:hypothetical protein
LATYEIKRPGDASWQDAGETIDEAEAAMRARNDRFQPSTIVYCRNNFNGSVTVFEVGSLSIGNRGSYQRFYATDQVPS